MDEKTTYWASVILGAIALVLLVINVSLVNGNRHMQEDIAQRQAVISNGVTLNQLNKGLVQALADISVKNSDTEARELLAAQGITLGGKAADDAKKKAAADSAKSLDNKEP